MALGSPVTVRQQGDGSSSPSPSITAGSNAGVLHLITPDPSYYSTDQVSWLTANVSAELVMELSLSQIGLSFSMAGWQAQSRTSCRRKEPSLSIWIPCIPICTYHKMKRRLSVSPWYNYPRDAESIFVYRCGYPWCVATKEPVLVGKPLDGVYSSMRLSVYVRPRYWFTNICCRPVKPNHPTEQWTMC